MNIIRNNFLIILTTIIFGTFSSNTFAEDSEMQKKLKKRHKDITNREKNYKGPIFNPKFEFYTQEIKLKLKNGVKLDAGQVKIASLPENKKYAFTTRWDDNTLNDVTMQKSLRKCGWFGTFYLNNPDNVVMGAMTLDQMRGLGRNGDSVGTHSWTHPYLAYTSKNNQFIEIAKLRAALEARLDVSVNSHAFAFMNQSHYMDPVTSRSDVFKILFRSGIISVATDGVGFVYWPNRFPATRVVNAGKWFNEERFKESLQEIDLKMHNPAFCFGIHAWSFWNKFDEAEATFTQVGNHNPDYWYCNQNQYAAYRWHWLLGEISAELEGEMLSISLKRPKAMDLGDNMPVDIVLPGISISDIEKVDSSLYELKEVNGTLFLRVAHNADLLIPEKIDFVENKDNNPGNMRPGSDFPFIKGVLSEDKDNTLTLKIESAEDISAVRVTYRLPLSHKEGVVFKHFDKIQKGKLFTDLLKPVEVSDDYLYRDGKVFYLVQIDFTYSNKLGRIYFSTYNEHKVDPVGYPISGFVKCGPIATNVYSKEMEAAVVNGDFSALKEYKFQPIDIPAAAGKELERESFSLPGMDFFHGESLPLLGRWHTTHCEPLRGVFLFYADVIAEEDCDVWLRSSFLQNPEQKYKRVLKKIYVNGELIEYSWKILAKLKKGKNTILLVTLPDGNYDGDLGAVLIRIADPETGERIKSIRYKVPGNIHMDRRD